MTVWDTLAGSCRHRSFSLALPPLRNRDSKRSGAYQTARRKQDGRFRMLVTCRGRLRRAVRVKITRDKFRQLTGCSPKVLQDWIEQKFQPEMTWDNYGLWEVDHIRPCSSFDMRIKSERLACFHYTNLQPLWRRTNRQKSKWIPPQGTRVRPSLYP